MSRRGAFKDDDLGDIDDLLPPSPPPVTTTPPIQAVPPTAAVTDAQAPVAPAPKPARRAAAKAAAPNTEAPKRSRQPARSQRANPIHEAHVAAVVAEALRQLTHSEKSHRGRGRSYGEVVLDAIEEFETELREHFSREATAKPKGRLFQRVDHTRPRRRRHTEPPVKIPLAGIIATDIESLDLLAEEWHTGSRSALVDQALKFYLADEIASLSNDADRIDDGEESAD
ncbi:hypothetical protein JK358_35590 [Nocardia sp. 2]|uniref:Ribbon-helix-helix protein CopG domain-containing protein n=1 Tax=Nocardia acididurans TaxID=2802282 RepID=A0ABS1MGE1_9NOCA|nr:hypothetical protein [Nocardia acididurans]MBL1079738.1 hypothetical protein [Nocardia acididurans]